MREVSIDELPRLPALARVSSKPSKNEDGPAAGRLRPRFVPPSPVSGSMKNTPRRIRPGALSSASASPKRKSAFHRRRVACRAGRFPLTFLGRRAFTLPLRLASLRRLSRRKRIRRCFLVHAISASIRSTLRGSAEQISAATPLDLSVSTSAPRGPHPRGQQTSFLTPIARRGDAHFRPISIRGDAGDSPRCCWN